MSAGLQLGLGLLMGVLGLKLILATPWLGFGSLALAVRPDAHSALPGRTTRAGCRHARRMGATGNVGIAQEFAIAPGMPHLVVPSWAEVWRGF